MLDEAIEAYNKSISLKPDYADTYSNMGVTLQDQGKLEKAIVAHNKAISLKPNLLMLITTWGMFSKIKVSCMRQ